VKESLIVLDATTACSLKAGREKTVGSEIVEFEDVTAEEEQYHPQKPYRC
jgi:hypothetical protein